MAFPNRKARPGTDNLAKVITVGTPTEKGSFDPDSLAASVVQTTSPAEYSLGNPVPEQEPSDNASDGLASDPQGQSALEPNAPDGRENLDEIDDDRFRGKPKKALYEAYKNLERLHGEHSAEVSTYRRLYEQEILKPRMEAEKDRQVMPEHSKPENDVDLLNEMLSSPTKFAKRIREDSKRELMADLVERANIHTVRAELSAQQQIVTTPEFREWLVANVPQHVAQSADADPSTLKFILTSYKASNPSLQDSESSEPANAERQTTPTAQKPANVDRRIPVGNAIGVSSTARQSSNPTFTMAQLADMQLNRPDEYARRQPEIMAWYSSQQNKK